MAFWLSAWEMVRQAQAFVLFQQMENQLLSELKSTVWSHDYSEKINQVYFQTKRARFGQSLYSKNSKVRRYRDFASLGNWIINRTHSQRIIHTQFWTFLHLLNPEQSQLSTPVLPRLQKQAELQYAHRKTHDTPAHAEACEKVLKKEDDSIRYETVSYEMVSKYCPLFGTSMKIISFGYSC